MTGEIEKPSPDDVLVAIQSFNDPAIVTNLFEELGWSYSFEIRETISLAKQNANLSIKMKAIKHLRGLLREAAEAAGYTANVSQSFPNPQGGHTTFSAKRMAGALNPTKQIESTVKEPKNERETEEPRPEPNRGSDRRENQSDSIRDTRRAFPIGDAGSGGTEPSDRGETPRADGLRPDNQKGDDGGTGNPCIKTRPPTCDRGLFPGISTPAED